MPISKTWNGQSYSIPQTGEFNWQSLTDFLAALADNAQTVNFQKIAVRVATTSPATVASATDCIVVTNLSVAGPVAVTLPPGVDKQIFFIVDGKGDAATNNITIDGDGAETINGAATYVINVNRGGIGIIYKTGQGWTVFAEFGNATGSTSYISRAKIEAGSANQVIINDGSGFLSSEAQLASTRGGTGVSNAGSLTYGANNITLTTSGSTTLTLPLTGTLATLAGSEILSSKTLASPVVSGGSIDVTGAGALAIGASVGANNITLGGATSTTVIPGNLTIQGTTTTVNTTTLDVKDANITVNKGGTDAGSEGSGLTIDRVGTKGSLIYKAASPSKFALGALGAEVNVVDESSTQTLTNKTLSGGTVSNSAVTASSLTVSGAANLNGGTTLGDASGDSLTINSSAVSIPNSLNFDSNTLVIDSTNDRVGIGTATPAVKLDVAGSLSAGSVTLDNITGNTSTLSISPLGTSAATLTVANNATVSGQQKNIAIGNNGTSGSETIVSIGSATSGALNRVTFNGKQAIQIPAGNSTTDRPATPADGMIRYNTTDTAFEGYSTAGGGWTAIGGGGAVDRVTVGSPHGFAVGDVLYLNGSTYTKAQANAAPSAEAVGVVSKIISTAVFEITLAGEVTGITSPASLVAGTVYFLSDTTPGLLTASEPSTVGYVSVPVGVATSTTSLYVQIKRGMVVGGANARTQITLANNATTDVQDVATYEAGELAGWVSLVNTTAASSLRFFVRAPFAKYGGSANYYISPSYLGDTPPVGFAMTVTAAGKIQITMPNWSGYSSAVINYALNAPAVGTNFPLSVDGTQITGGTVSASYLPVAGASSSGIVTTGSQTIAGQKTFTGQTQVGGGSFTAGFDFQVCALSTATAVLIKSGNAGSGATLKFSDPGGVSVDTTIGHLSTTSRFQVRCGATGGVELSSGATSWAAISDERLKKNIKPIEYGLNEIVSLKPVRFDYITDNSDESKRIGFIAQDVIKFIPECVSGSDEEKYSLSMTEIIPALVKSVQQLKSELDAVKAELAALKA